MQGDLASRGIRVGQNRVGQSLAPVRPAYHRARQRNTSLQTNPIPYNAEYFGHKLHIDQNEKLVMYGVTHVCAIDGYSGKAALATSRRLSNFLVLSDFSCTLEDVLLMAPQA